MEALVSIPLFAKYLDIAHQTTGLQKAVLASGSVAVLVLVCVLLLGMATVSELVANLPVAAGESKVDLGFDDKKTPKKATIDAMPVTRKPNTGRSMLVPQC